MDDLRPTWQTDPCPGWCTRGHTELDHPDDRVHRGIAVTVPVVTRRTSYPDGAIRRSTDAIDLEVAISRVDGDQETWAYIGSGPGASVEVTVESAERLVAVLTGALIRSRSRP